MKTAQWRKLAKQYLLPHLPDCQFDRSLVIFEQVDWVLHVLSLDTSVFSAVDVSLELISHPLYAPTSGLIGDYAQALRNPTGGFGWVMQPGEEDERMRDVLKSIQEQASDFFRRTAEPGDLGRYSEQRYVDSINPPTIEVEAYSWILSGDLKKARRTLDRFERELATMPTTIRWRQPLVDRYALICDAFAQGSEVAIQMLRAWRDDSLRNMKLDRFI